MTPDHDNNRAARLGRIRCRLYSVYDDSLPVQLLPKTMKAILDKRLAQCSIHTPLTSMHTSSAFGSTKQCCTASYLTGRGRRCYGYFIPHFLNIVWHWMWSSATLDLDAVTFPGPGPITPCLTYEKSNTSDSDNSMGEEGTFPLPWREPPTIGCPLWPNELPIRRFLAQSAACRGTSISIQRWGGSALTHYGDHHIITTCRNY